jgi:hypothetical protein
MKKIIKSSVLFVAACFFAGAVSAQLASDKPAMTAQQMTDLIQKRKADAAKSAATTSATVSVSSDKPAMTPQQHEQLMKRTIIEVKAEPAKIVTPVPAIPSQGGVKPVTSEAAAAETKGQAPSAQTEKPVPAKQQ